MLAEINNGMCNPSNTVDLLNILDTVYFIEMDVDAPSESAL